MLVPLVGLARAVTLVAFALVVPLAIVADAKALVEWASEHWVIVTAVGGLAATAFRGVRKALSWAGRSAWGTTRAVLRHHLRIDALRDEMYAALERERTQIRVEMLTLRAELLTERDEHLRLQVDHLEAVQARLIAERCRDALRAQVETLGHVPDC